MKSPPRHQAPNLALLRSIDGLGPDAKSRAFLAAGDIALQTCAPCGSLQYYPSVVCRSCGAPISDWVISAGLGVVYAFTAISAETQTNVAIVELDEGVRLVSRLVGCDIALGARVSAKFSQDPADPPLLFEILA